MQMVAHFSVESDFDGEQAAARNGLPVAAVIEVFAAERITGHTGRLGGRSEPSKDRLPYFVADAASIR
jgi:hypothetical protein